MRRRRVNVDGIAAGVLRVEVQKELIRLGAMEQLTGRLPKEPAVERDVGAPMPG